MSGANRYAAHDEYGPRRPLRGGPGKPGEPGEPGEKEPPEAREVRKAREVYEVRDGERDEETGAPEATGACGGEGGRDDNRADTPPEPGHHDGPDSPGSPGSPDDGGFGGSGRSGGPGGPGGPGEIDGDSGRTPGPPRIPAPRVSVEDGGLPLPDPGSLPAVPSPAPRGAADGARRPEPDVPAPLRLPLPHEVLTSLLGAWALAACSPEEAAAVEEHLGTCELCAEESERLRAAVGLLQQPDSLDLDPALRTRVLHSCLERRPPRIPVPGWADAYDAETARLDALLQDIGEAEWHAPVRLRWFDGRDTVTRRTTVAGVIAHLMTVDGLVAVALGLDDPMGATAVRGAGPERRTEAYWDASHFPPTRAVRGPWREQSHHLVRTVAFTGSGAGKLGISYGDFELPLHDAMLDRAFECWVHADDIARAVDYPYDPPAPRHLHGMIDLAARLLPTALAERRRAGLARPGARRHLVSAGGPGRSLRLEIEGVGGGEWLIPLDSPGAVGSAAHEVAHVALDGVEFCRLAAGRVSPDEAAAGQAGDRDAISDVLCATASLSRM